MKKIYVLRHSNWDLDRDALTKEGLQKAEAFRKRLDNPKIVISSPKDRTIETAKVLSGKNPVIDNRADIPDFSDEQNRFIRENREFHPLGVPGVIFEKEELIFIAKKAGERFLELLDEVLLKLDGGQSALILSHDGTMIPAEKLLLRDSFEKNNKTFHELEGFVVDENLNIRNLK
ncbi:hypothetical protein BVX95_00130 [archaeon D22]|nr:hypothetical protein BVX95_00130 [archaeon D22]